LKESLRKEIHMTKVKNLKELFKEKKIIYTMGAHNGLSAKLAQKNNFDAIWASGLEISASYALPDADILTMTEFLEKSSEMNEAVNLPIISDCDTGYGNSNNVIHLVKKYEAAGIAAICLEDKLFPKVNSFIKGRQELASIAEFVGKIMAAKSVQRNENFMFIARTEALIAGWEEEEALLRAEKYVDAGADAILIHSKMENYDEIISFAKKWDNRAPLVIVPTTYPQIMADFSDEDLLKLGIRVVIFANQGIRASIKAMDKTMGMIRRTRGAEAIDKDIAPLREVFELQGMMEMKDSERRYLKTAANEFNAIVLAAGNPKDQDGLGPLLRDRPVALLDINGETLIKRNISTLSRFSINQTFVVTGYHSEQFKMDGVTFIKNPDYKDKDVLHSLMLAGDKLQGRVLLAYADILFDRGLIDKLLKCESDIVLVGDPTFKKMNSRNKKLDLLISDSVPNNGYRSIETNNGLKRIVQIGESVSEEKAHYEFVGLALFSEKGLEEFKKVYNELKLKSERDPVKKNFGQMKIEEVFQALVDKKFSVSVLEVNSGWMEIHTFENYKMACSVLSEK
jgi:phosphoenolpyruvate phosphomutase